MRKKLWCLLLAAVLLIGGVSLTAQASPAGGDPADNPASTEEIPDAASEPPEASEAPEETDSPQLPQEPETPAVPWAPEEPPEPEEPEEPEPTLEELRDTLTAILGDGEETEAIRANMDRLIALGDPGDALRQWLESTIRKYQLLQELEQLTGVLGALEASSGELDAIAQAAAELAAEPDELLLSIGEVCPTAAALLEALEGFDPAGEQAARLGAILSGRDGTAAGDSLTAVRLLAALKDSGLLDEEGTAAAQSALAAELGRLMELCRTVTGQERARLERASEALAARANLAQPFSPARLAVVGRELTYTEPLFTYDGAIMLSIADAAGFLGGEVEEQGDTLAIIAPNMVLELVKGSSDGYLNDKLCKLSAPVLSFDRTYFLPLDTVLECCGMERTTVEGYELLCRPIAPAAAE